MAHGFASSVSVTLYSREGVAKDWFLRVHFSTALLFKQSTKFQMLLLIIFHVTQAYFLITYALILTSKWPAVANLNNVFINIQNIL